jgi:cell division septation protein DedD
MQQRNSTFIALLAIGVIVSMGWYIAGQRGESTEQTAVPVPTVKSPAVKQAAMTPVANQEPQAPAMTPDRVAQLITDSTGGDAGKRAEALPVLRRILTDGEPQVDRPLALRSLRDLALNQGDDDGAIREAVRNSIYHGDDFTKADDAQEVLDIIEESRQK